MTLLVLSIFGDLERFSADNLYPHRYVVGIVAAAAILAILGLSWRLHVARLLWGHRVTSAVIGVPLLVIILVLGNYLLSPLWERSFVQESSPVEAAVGGDAEMKAASGESMTHVPLVRRHGNFKGADGFHYAEGSAQLIEEAGGTWVVRFESFTVRNGPDLYVYLSHGGDNRVDESLNLGRLKATDGSFNYAVPAGLDLSKVKSVIVWCRQFGVRFGSAPLDPI